MLVDGAEDEWQIHHWASNMEAVLAATLRSGNDEANQAARELIHRLGPAGFCDLRVFLTNVDRGAVLEHSASPENCQRLESVGRRPGLQLVLCREVDAEINLAAAMYWTGGIDTRPGHC